MKDPKKQKLKTYERRKKAYKKEQRRKENIRNQIRTVEDEIEEFSSTLSNRKIDLGCKLCGGTIMGIVWGLAPVFLPSDAEHLNEILKEFVQKVEEEPLIATTPLIGFVLGMGFLNFTLGLNKDLSKISEIKEAFRYNKSLLSKKAELEAKLERKSYVDSDKARNKGNAKTYKK